MNRDDQNKPRIPDYDPSKAMDSKKEVKQSNDEKTDQDYPGYPHYPAKEDMMGRESGNHKVDRDVEQLASGQNKTGVNQRFEKNDNRGRNALDGGNEEEQEQAGENSASAVRNDELGVPQNVSNSDLKTGGDLPGTDINEAAGNNKR